jgi:ribonuclease Z
VDLSVVFLGTGARAPTRERGVSATLVARAGEHLLIDCGEGTQRQMLASTAGLRHVTTILITHGHGDHVLGLPGLLATFSETPRERLTVLGPAGTAGLIDAFRPFFGALAFELVVREMEGGEAEERDGYDIEAVTAAHASPALAWAIRERPRRGHLDPERLARLGVPPGPERARLAAGGGVGLPGGATVSPADVTGPRRRGRLLVLSGDTAPSSQVTAAARGADLLVHEATFLERDAALAARAGHSTAAGAARVARSARATMLALTHRSSRYRREEIEAEARAVFPNTVVPSDFDLIEVPLPDRAPPRLRPGAGRAPVGPAAPDDG